MQDDHHDKAVRDLARDICARAEVCTMADTANETGALVAELLELPILTATDLTEREAWLALLLWKKTQAAKRFIALVV